MFDISWAELAVLGAVGVAVTGKRDLPKACNFVGHQLGRVVGLLQGARTRADRFAHHNELKALQNELRSGLRELDQVKMELAVAASSRGVMGRGLGATTMSANKRSKLASLRENSTPTTFSPPPMANNRTLTGNGIIENDVQSGSNKNNSVPLSLSDFDFHAADSIDQNTKNPDSAPATPIESDEHTVGQSERAVMEEEWIKQGIGFRAQAEKGSWIADSEDNIESIKGGLGDGSDASIIDTTRATGSELLEHLERQNLIFVQYDRVVDQNEREMERQIERIQKERKSQPNQGESGDNGKR